MQVDKSPFPMDMVEVGAPAILIHLKQADKAQGKNVIIGEPHAALNVEKNSGRKLVLEKDDDGKNNLKITAGSRQYLRRQRWYKTTAAQQRPVLVFLSTTTKNRITPTNSNGARNNMVIINLSLLQ
jgi:hypothetical protein